PPTAHVAERVGDEECQRPDPLIGELRARAQPVAEQVFLAKVLTRCGDGSGVRFAEQVVRVLAWALAGGALRQLDWRHGGRFGLGSRGKGKQGPAGGAGTESESRPHANQPQNKAPFASALARPACHSCSPSRHRQRLLTKLTGTAAVSKLLHPDCALGRKRALPRSRGPPSRLDHQPGYFLRIRTSTNLS